MPHNVVLIGFSGSGKSRIGRALAQRLGWPLVDTDARLVSRFGCSIGEFFRVHGEAAFRSAESEEVVRACAEQRHVISVGGGAPVRAGNWAAIADRNLVVRLHASLETIWRRLHEMPGGEERPMLSGDDARGRMAKLLADRESVYARAHLTIETDDLSVDEVVDRIVSAIEASVA